MSGILTTRSYIAALDIGSVRAVEAAIPDGHELQVSTTPDWWLMYLIRDKGRLAGPLRISRGMPLERAALFALDHWAKKAVTA